MNCIAEPAKTGITLKIISEEGKEVYLHSRINPAADNSLAETSGKKINTLIVIGLALGYHIESILQTTSAVKILVIDTCNSFPVIRNENIQQSFFSDNRVHIITAADLDKNLPHYLHTNEDSPIFIADHLPSARALPSLHKQCRSVIERYISKKTADTATVSRFGYQFFKNALLNIRRADNSPSLNSFFGQFKQFDALVISSGPTLDKHIKEMHAFQKSYFIIATDSAVPTLVSSGIIPDFIFSIDPQKYTWEHTYTAPSHSLILHSLTAHVENDSRRHLYYLNTHPLCQLLESLDHSLPNVDARSGNVTGDAVLFALRCSFRRIILLGLDSSFPAHSVYSRGTAYNFRFINKTNRLLTNDDLHMHYIRSSSSNTVLNGKKTRRSFINYKQQIERQLSGKNSILQISSGGIPLDGIGQLNTIPDNGMSIPKTGLIDDLIKATPTLALPRKQIRQILLNPDNHEELFTIALGNSSNHEKHKQKIVRFIKDLV